MASFLLFAFYLLTELALLSSGEEETEHPRCPPFPCGDHHLFKFPFTSVNNTSCGIFPINCSEIQGPTIQFKPGGHWYKIAFITQMNSVFINDTDLGTRHFDLESCESVDKFSFPASSVFSNVSINSSSNVSISSSSLFNCSHEPPRPLLLEKRVIRGCEDYDIYNISRNSSLTGELRDCSVIELPVDTSRSSDDGIFLATGFLADIRISRDCDECFYVKKGRCGVGSDNDFTCFDEVRSKRDGKFKRNLGLGLGLSIGSALCLLIGFILYRRHKRRHDASNMISRNISDGNMNCDVEAGSVLFGVPVFSYKDLQEATNNFDSEKELGDGGFGTVYYGVLKDGREVAVKRLYEHNYRRLEQFMNEIEILTRLRHKNLVSLYGCTSRRCRELLLVYEFIPNGTVADHLHGHLAPTSPLPWPLRLVIALETADALAFLHASDTVHRDVKTANILLDANFSVKVADFGLSRLFPSDVTHVSTAPQGTPGYVDPEYHQCYQLTSKSDVYSFGVVLAELISSKPAVDITRHRHEINLSNLAVSKIQKRAYGELIDPGLGVERGTVAVAELAFQCLQQDKEMRPTMEEVLEELKAIRGDDERGSRASPSPECDEVGLLRNGKVEPPSPTTVTEAWLSSRSTTPNIST